MVLLKDEEIKGFLNEQDAKKFFAKQEEAQTYINCYISELTAHPVDNAPLLVDDIRKLCQISSDVSDDSIKEAMETTKLALSYPGETITEAAPVGMTAYETMMQRAGFTAAPVLYSLKNRAGCNEMSPTNKSQILNMGFECFTGKALILKRDEKIRAVLSGDPDDYSVLPVTELFDVLTNKLSVNYPKKEFISGTASHEFATLTYRLNDEALENQINEVFRSKGIKMSGTPCVRLVTSDVGLSGANLFPFILDEAAREFPLGFPLSLTHKNRHNAEDFEKNVMLIASSFKDASVKLEEMGSKKVKHKKDMILNVCKKMQLPKKLSFEGAEEFDNLYGFATQLDVYSKVFEIFDTYIAAISPSQDRIFQMEEQLARMVFMDFDSFDIPSFWN